MPLYKRCDRCGTRLAMGTVCKCSNRRYKHEALYVDDKSKQFYLSSDWLVKRAKVIATYNQLDVYDLYVNKTISYGRTLHHIVPIKDDWSKRLCDTNLIYLTDSNHQMVHNVMRKSAKDKKEMIGILTSLVLKYHKEYVGGG